MASAGRPAADQQEVRRSGRQGFIGGNRRQRPPPDSIDRHAPRPRRPRRALVRAASVRRCHARRCLGSARPGRHGRKRSRRRRRCRTPAAHRGVRRRPADSARYSQPAAGIDAADRLPPAGNRRPRRSPVRWRRPTRRSRSSISDDASDDGTWPAIEAAVAGYAGPHRRAAEPQSGQPRHRRAPARSWRRWRRASCCSSPPATTSRCRSAASA